jgi:prophage maintenance system killer protein
MNKGEIIIYTLPDGTSDLDVKLENDTVWLTQEQIAMLFGTKRPAITKHLGNIFKSGELSENSVCSILEHTASDGKNYQTKFYNLDAILSVGYRVNSKNATKFRIWANSVLKDYLIKGYALNQKAKLEQLEDLKKTIKLLTNVIETKKLTLDEAGGMLRVLADYSYGLDVLDGYDYGTLSLKKTTAKEKFKVTYENAAKTIADLKKKFDHSALFGVERDNSFKSSVATIYQTFGGRELYPSLEEKAAMLLYLVVKNHSFTDGNKRIAAYLFLWFMQKNNILYGKDGSIRIANNALVALTLMIAESKSQEKDIMAKVVVNLINKDN